MGAKDAFTLISLRYVDIIAQIVRFSWLTMEFVHCILTLSVLGKIVASLYQISKCVAVKQRIVLDITNV
jgi:hypothetical protein